VATLGAGAKASVGRKAGIIQNTTNQCRVFSARPPRGFSEIMGLFFSILLRRQGVLEFDVSHHILVHNETLLTQAGLTAVPPAPPHS
jgi:hypothetical protein